MRTCIRCGHAISEHTINCPSCGASQGITKRPPQAYDDTFLKVLCILTIVGASLALLSGAMTWGNISGMTAAHRTFQMLGILAAIGKLTGAILMLQKRLTGLYIYTAASVGNMLLTLAMAFGFDVIPKDDKVPQLFITISVVMGIAISLAFLIMYWLNVNRRSLS
ncbi:hypothetical protein [Flavobacterium sp.]|uniref:hypothetical protein n=1 Tax=Flavobacterium sp. TaxID=239 RepID=UPI004034B5CE